MFKPGDLLKHKTFGWYCIYVKNDQVHIILDETPHYPFSEGYSFIIDRSNWEVLYRDESEVPDALYTGPEGMWTGGAVPYKEPIRCNCDIVFLMQSGCKCGGS